MSRYPVFVDGAFHEALAPTIAVEDLGLVAGLAVFETILHEDRCLYFLDEHLARLADGARALAIAWPPPRDVAAAARAYAERLGDRTAAVRVILTRGVPGRGPTLAIGARDVAPVADPGARLAISRFTKRHDDPLEQIKSTNRLRNVVAREEALARGAWDALIPTEQGDLSEGTWCNLFALVGGRLITPALSRGCLAGTMRDQVLAELADRPLAPVVEGELHPRDLAAASEIFCTNTTGRVVPVIEVIDLVAGLPGAAGRVVTELRERIRAREGRYHAAHRRGV